MLWPSDIQCLIQIGCISQTVGKYHVWLNLTVKWNVCEPWRSPKSMLVAQMELWIQSRLVRGNGNLCSVIFLGMAYILEILEDTKIQNEFYLFHYSLLSDGILVLSGVSKKHFCDLGKWPIFPGKPLSVTKSAWGPAQIMGDSTLVTAPRGRTGTCQ